MGRSGKIKFGGLLFLIGSFGVIAAFSDISYWRTFDTTGFIILGLGAITIIGIIVLMSGLHPKMKRVF